MHFIENKQPCRQQVKHFYFSLSNNYFSFFPIALVRSLNAMLRSGEADFVVLFSVLEKKHSVSPFSIFAVHFCMCIFNKTEELHLLNVLSWADVEYYQMNLLRYLCDFSPFLFFNLVNHIDFQSSFFLKFIFN